MLKAKTVKLFSYLVFLGLAIILSLSPVYAVTFTKKQIAKSGKVSCAVYKNKWQPVVKKKTKYMLKKSPSKKDKSACKLLLVPSKKLSLDDVPRLATLARAKSSSSSAIGALAVSGTPPLLSEIPTLGPENVFWRNNVVSDVATGNPAPPESCQEFFGGDDGESSSFPGCFMAQGVAQSFYSVLSEGRSLCLMQSLPTQENLAAGGVIVTSGSLPSGGITKLFEAPPGSSSRLVKIALGMQDVFVKIPTTSSNAKKGNQYSYELYMCAGGVLQGYESTRITLGGTYRSTVQHPFGMSQPATGRGIADITADLVKTSAGLVFSTTADRTLEFTGVDGSNSTAAKITISADNTIKNRVREARADGTSTFYNESRFQGSTVNDLQFLEGAARGTFTHPVAGSRSFSGAAEYRNTFYASAPSSTFALNVGAIDFNSDPFYTKTLSVPALPSFDCNSNADIELQLNLGASSMELVLSACVGQELQNSNFCMSQNVVAAQTQFPMSCS